MFNVGDKVVCVVPMGPLKFNVVYIIKNSYIKLTQNFNFLCERVQLYNETSTYGSDRFITLKEYRKQKLKRLC